MTIFNLVHFSLRQPGRWRGMIGLAAGLLFTLPSQGLAQQTPDWGQWEEAAKGSDKNIPPGIGYGGHALCEGMRLSGKHVYWRCMPRCHNSSVVGDFCWEAVSDAIYSCPDGKGFRQAEKIRYSNVHCGKKDWLVTKRLADMYEEKWQTKVTDPTDDVTSPSPPTEKADLPSDTSDTPPQWDGGGPPWVPKEAEKDEPKTDTGKTDTAKTDATKTDTGKTDAGKTDTSKTDTGKTDTDKKVTGGSTTTPSGKKANRKEVQKQGKSIARRRVDDDYDQGGGLPPEAATAIGIGIGMGLGGMGRGGHMGGDRGRMMDR